MQPRRFLPALGLIIAVTALAATPHLIRCISQRAAPERKSDFDLDRENKPSPACAELASKMAAFRVESLTLAPAAAAEKWLGLFEEMFRISDEVRQSHNHARGRTGLKVDWENLLQSLPPTTSWDAIAAGLEQRATTAKPAKTALLRLIASQLTGNTEATKSALAQLKALPQSIFQGQQYSRQKFEVELDDFTSLIANREGKPDDVVAAYEKQLKRVEASDSSDEVQVPDLLRHLPEDKAAPLLLRALLTKEGCKVEGDKTRRLAARLALENVGKLRIPAWNLVEQVADIPLYEALFKKFGDKEGAGYDDHARASQVYLLLLIAEGRTSDAIAFLKQRHPADSTAGLRDAEPDPVVLHPGIIESMRRQGLGLRVIDFLKALLATNPALPYWENYIELSAHEKKSDEAVVFLRASLAKSGLTGAALEEVRRHLASALLAADQPDEAIALLRQNLAAPLPSGLTPKRLVKLNRERFYLAFRLARLGRLLQKPDLVGEGITSAIKLVSTPRENHELEGDDIEPLTTFLLNLNRPAEAEKLVREQLANLRKQPRKDYDYQRDRDSRNLLSQLASVLSHQGRHAEVVRLLDEAPDWDAPDLSRLGLTSYRGNSLLPIAARALAETGRKPLADKILRHHILRTPGGDASYELLLSLGEGDAMGFLEQVAARHRFEERPLIWKARLLLDSGKPVEAEKAIREAIAVDPSDGEQGKGDRMRAYAILGEILELKGDAKTAAIMRGAVQSIRLSEEGDDWWQAGMLSRAVTLYEKALTLFADAYCIQSRLALRYSEQGDYAKAEKHYRRAFELMPDSFGRVESHCFGCEGAFSGTRAQNIAEKVFSELAEKMPDKAQVFYLLGYLRSQQKRHAEAAEALRKAVKLDPDYLNAWKKLADLNDTIALPAPEYEQVIAQIHRLAPTDYDSRNIANIGNLRLLWDTLLATEKNHPPLENTPLYPLAASAKALGKSGGGLNSVTYEDDDKSPRLLFTQNPFLKSTGALVETLDEFGAMK